MTARIRAAIPDRDFTLILGSAYWAELALDPEADAARLRRLAHGPAMEAYLARMDQPVPGPGRTPGAGLSRDGGRGAVQAIDGGRPALFGRGNRADPRVVIEALRSIATTQARPAGPPPEQRRWQCAGHQQSRLATEEARSKQVATDLDKLCATTENRAQMALNNS